MKDIFLKTVSISCFIAILFVLSSSGAIGAEMNKKTLNLPKRIGAWTRPKAARIIDSGNIFKYMNGAGELYLAYGFDHLKVYEYSSDQQDSILVEVYHMNTSDDAFGLLSLDWGGEPVTIHSTSASPTYPTVSPPFRALYGGGLLRIWADTIYARVMAHRETTESKEAVISLGKAIVLGRKVTGEPDLLKVLPHNLDGDWKLRKDRVAYFRSHLVFNSIYYLSHQNILLLDHSTEAVAASFEKVSEGGTKKRVQVLFAKYADVERARKALSHFHSAYLHDQKKEIDQGVNDNRWNFYKIEDGWLGYLRDRNCLFIAFECPDQQSARLFLKNLSYNPINREKSHGE
jgi:hypothetical protein